MTTAEGLDGDLLAEVAALRREVAGLRARFDIQDLIVAYARACDVGNDPVLLRPLFTDDATWRCLGFGSFVGGDQCALGLKAIAGEKIWWSLHNMISPRIEIAPSGIAADGFWYLWEAATLPNEQSGEAEAYWIGGTYDASFRLVDGRWRFREVELKLNLATPASVGWVKQRFPAGSDRQPYFVHLQAGTTYRWCSCGKSSAQPFCDGSHGGTGLRPVAFSVEKSGLQAICGCRYSKAKPLCDGSHLNLKLDWNALKAAD